MAQSRINLLRGLLLGMCGCIVACGGPPSAPSEVAPEVSSSPATVGEPPAVPLTAAEPTASDPVPAAPLTVAESEPAADLETTQIIPGERFGPLTSETSRADLVALFGVEALQDTEIPAGEGTTEPGTQVNLGPGKSFSVVWVDDSQTRPLLVKEFGPAWRTPDGLGLGTSFAELQTVLGPFSFYGFGWDYGGTVILEGTNLDPDYGLLIMRLQPDIDPNQVLPEVLQSVMGDGTFDSEAVDLAGVDVTVGEMIVYLNDLP
ncbi:MAG: hypothetical protein ACFB0C_04650 [Leptolyngbyaceae cyanobacterium]